MEAIAPALVSAFVSNAFSDDGPSNRAADASSNAANVSADASRTQAGISKDMWDYYKSNFQPLDTSLVGQANTWLSKVGTYGSPAEQEKAAGVAHADNTQAFSRARDANTRAIASYGINPASGRFANANLKSNLEEAKSDVLAQNTARQGVKDVGFNKDVAATQIASGIDATGRGIPAAAISGLGSAAGTANTAASTSFQQAQTLAAQQRAGLAPLATAAASGVKKWFNTPTDDQPLQLSGPT